MLIIMNIHNSRVMNMMEVSDLAQNDLQVENNSFEVYMQNNSL